LANFVLANDIWTTDPIPQYDLLRYIQIVNQAIIMFYSSLIGASVDHSTSFALTTATQAESAARQAKTDVELFKHDIDRLLLITEALWTLAKQQNGYTDDVLVKLIQDIDQRRSNASGVAIKDAPVACPACGRPNMAARNFCMYCGGALPANPFAR
jgi:hypothetical protein